MTITTIKMDQDSIGHFDIMGSTLEHQRADCEDYPGK